MKLSREEDIYENLKNSSFAEVANHGILLLGKETCYLEKKGLASEAHKSVCHESSRFENLSCGTGKAHLSPYPAW